MSRFHINPKTGNPGKCNALKSCPFGGDEVHYPTPDNARKAYELSMAPVEKALLAVKPDKDAQEDEQAEKGKQGIAAFLAQASNVVPSNFAELKETVRHEDLEHGIARSMVNLRNTQSQKWSFKAVMGDVRRTEKALRSYEDRLREEVGRNDEALAYALKVAKFKASRQAYGRAFQANVPIDPAIEAKFEAIWEGKARGQSHDDLLEDARDAQDSLDKLSRGELSPRDVVGSGIVNPKKAAKQYLEEQINELALALQTRGRSNSVNVSNATFELARS